MASPLKTLGLRSSCQSATAGLLGRAAVPKASFSTARPTTVCLSAASKSLAGPNPFTAASVALPRSFARAASSAAKPAPGSQPALDWNSFFKLRLSRRRYQLISSIFAGGLGLGAGAWFLSSSMAEPLVGQVPLDPMVTFGLVTVAFVGMGWLIGPSIGNELFYLVHRQWKRQMMEKEAQFFARIKKYRVDPANSTAQNPVPDFYGEKIQSVSGYRLWLKDQRAFNKKKTANIL